MNKEKDLSIIVPFRDNKKISHFIRRLEELCNLLPTNDKRFECIVVDSGSPLESQEKVKAICDKSNVSYFYHDTLGEPFSIGAARDFGVSVSSSKAITFLDVDLRFSQDFWERLLVLKSLYGISEFKKSFLVVPCMYLTERGTEEYKNNKTNLLDYYLRWLQGDKSSVQNMALCSSVMILDRLYYLSIGGHRPEFRGHGYEDFELYHRLATEEGIIPRPDNYYVDSKTWDTSTYNGFRSQFTVFGRYALMMGLFVVHLWHPRPKDDSFYSPEATQRNRDIWVDLFKQFDDDKIHPAPLVDSSVKNERVLFFGKQFTPAANCLREVFPLIGQPLFVSEHVFINDNNDFSSPDFERFINQNKITKVLFANPYGNEARLKIYNWCKSKKIPYLVYERGALPDSWFFDDKGFNSESSSYSEAYWDFDLTQDKKESVIEYIRESIKGDKSLETQGDRIGAEALLQKLRVGGKKVLFVPMQRPSDTVIRYMKGSLSSYDEFVGIIDQVANFLQKLGWDVICKKHPLETKHFDLKYARYAPDDTHFLDLIEASDAVALVNSGVGVYAMMLQKPCYIFGDAFYHIQGVNVKIKDYDPSFLAERIAAGYQLDVDKAYKFIHYLVNDFYSFGHPVVTRRKEPDGSFMTITNQVDFYRIAIPNHNAITYNAFSRPKVYPWSPVLERFQLDIANKKKAQTLASSNNNAIKGKKDSLRNSDIKSKFSFKVYKALYSPFLSDLQKKRLANDPADFFRKAKKPISLLGKKLVGLQ